MRAVVLGLVALVVVGCGDEAPYSETVAFPSAGDTWSGGLAGVIEVGGFVEGTRGANDDTRELQIKLRFGGSGLNCAPKLSVRADADGHAVTAAIEPPQGALEARTSVRFPESVTGRVTLRTTLVESDCGPIGVSVTESTVTFAE